MERIEIIWYWFLATQIIPLLIVIPGIIICLIIIAICMIKMRKYKKKG